MTNPDCHGFQALSCGCVTTAPGDVIQRCTEHERRRLKRMRYRHRKAALSLSGDAALFASAMTDLGVTR